MVDETEAEEQYTKTDSDTRNELNEAIDFLM